MSDDTTTIEEEVTPKPAGKAKATRSSESKWGAEVMALGFCVLPSLIFRAQARLGLSPTQLAVLLQLADFWWDSGRKPFPKKADLAERLNLSDRQVQRHIADLELAGFVKRIERTYGRRGKISNEYDLSGLVTKLKALEPQYREVADEAKARKKAVSKPGYDPKKIKPKRGTT
ncbi:helix-turn-helix domain-containing protein [Brevundimonas diminuta]|uniref:helix-turn-helix domain-containing protein n=1 Tax=Brevundimonas diminuta TaxID=293 RepID=UPI003D9A77AD